jgi:hypothetical protein
VGGAAAVSVVLIVVLAGILIPAATKSLLVHVSAVTLSFAPGDNPCFPTNYTNQTPVTVIAGGSEAITVPLSDQSNGGARDCTVESVSVLTPGFSLASANVPLHVGASGSSTLSILVNYPPSGYSGPLNLTASVTYVLPTITVTSLNFSWVPSSNPCGLDSPVAYYPHFVGFAGGDFNNTAGYASIFSTNSCTLIAVTTPTPGFAVISANVPDPIPQYNFGGVSFELQLPSTAYNGTLEIDLDLSF